MDILECHTVIQNLHRQHCDPPELQEAFPKWLPNSEVKPVHKSGEKSQSVTTGYINYQRFQNWVDIRPPNYNTCSQWGIVKLGDFGGVPYLIDCSLFFHPRVHMHTSTHNLSAANCTLSFQTYTFSWSYW